MNKGFEGIKGIIKQQEPLSEYTSFKIGGPAKYFVKPRDARDLKLLLERAKKYRIPVLVLGSGSNLLVSDKGVNAMVLKLDSVFFGNLSFRANRLTAGCGVPLSRLIRSSTEHSLSGAEFLAGIPGRLGGALAMNAGAWGKSIGDLVENVRVMDGHGNIKVLHRNEIRFGYRSSSLAKYVILSARLRLNKGDKKEIGLCVKGTLKRRLATQDYSLRSAGCVFRNPPGESAGRLIDSCGLKGRVCGDAKVSHRHANFILNRGKAKAADVLKLMNLIQKKVKQEFNISLDPEIKIWP